MSPEDRALVDARMATGVVEQSEVCQELADELEACGHYDLTVLDLLDCLASTGLVLARMPGVATVDYFRVLAPERFR